MYDRFAMTKDDRFAGMTEDGRRTTDDGRQMNEGCVQSAVFSVQKGRGTIEERFARMTEDR